MAVKERLSELGIELFPDIKPIGSYVPYVRTGNLVFVSGQGPSIKGKYVDYIGKVGDGISKEKAKEAARATAVNLISILNNAVGDLDRVERIVSVHGFVNSTPDFTEQPYVIDGASELLAELFGDKGRHSRCAVSAPSLPLGICVEIELIAEVKSEV
jgi:enamine deaminase RidA (YjgF/YER057c/UK114 family)